MWRVASQSIWYSLLQFSAQLPHFFSMLVPALQWGPKVANLWAKSDAMKPLTFSGDFPMNQMKNWQRHVHVIYWLQARDCCEGAGENLRQKPFTDLSLIMTWSNSSDTSWSCCWTLKSMPPEKERQSKMWKCSERAVMQRFLGSVQLLQRLSATLSEFGSTGLLLPTVWPLTARALVLQCLGMAAFSKKWVATLQELSFSWSGCKFSRKSFLKPMQMPSYTRWGKYLSMVSTTTWRCQISSDVKMANL